MKDLYDYAVFRDLNSHCVIRVHEEDHHTQFLALIEDAGELRIDLLKWSDRDFHHSFKELAGYPVRRAALHFANPLTSAIVVTAKANKILQSILKEHHMNTTTNPGQSNVTSTAAASVKTANGAGHKPTAAPVKAKKPTATDQKKAADKIAKQKDADKKNAAAAKQADKDAAAAAKAAAKGKAPPKVVKAAKAAKAAAKPHKPTPAKKVAKLVRNPKHEAVKAPAKKAAAKKAAATGTRESYADRKIKALVKLADLTVREGTFRGKFVPLILAAKNTNEVLNKKITISGEQHIIDGSVIAFMVRQEWIALT